MFSSSQVNIPPQPIVVARTLAELLAYQDQQFVSCAYKTLLQRDPDPEGLSSYLGQLQSGYIKMHILEQIYLSPEGRSKGVKLPGLDTAIKRYQKINHPVLGWLYRLLLLNNIEGDDPGERRLRVIEQQLSLSIEESKRRFDRLEEMLIEQQNQFIQKEQPIVTVNGSDRQGNISLAMLSSQPLLSAKFRQMPLRARGIYFYLKAAVGNSKEAA